MGSSQQKMNKCHDAQFHAANKHVRKLSHDRRRSQMTRCCALWPMRKKQCTSSLKSWRQKQDWLLLKRSVMSEKLSVLKLMPRIAYATSQQIYERYCCCLFSYMYIDRSKVSHRKSTNSVSSHEWIIWCPKLFSDAFTSYT